MTVSAFTKGQRRELRRLVDLAYDRELSAASAALQGEFERWRRGEIDVFALNEQIHQFHDDISRELYKRYVMEDIAWAVVSAMVAKVIQETEVEPTLRQQLQGRIETMRRSQ